MGKKETPPDVIYDKVINPEVARCVGRIFAFMAGTTNEYDNIEQVIEESLWIVYVKGANSV